MVKNRIRLILAGVATFAMAAVLLAPAARAGWDGTPPASGGSPQPVSASTSGSSGTPTQGTVRTCSLYATSSSFGVSCFHGGGDAKTVGEILKKDPKDFCWDEKISDADLENKYQYQQNPDAPYYLHSCVTGLILTNSQYNQPDVVLSQQVIEIPQDATECTGKRPYPGELVGTCIMRLTDKQRLIVGGLDANGGQIPGIILTTHPSTRVRTNEQVAYTDSAEGGITRTATYQVGGVTMWAKMDRFSIHPYGADGVSKTCNGTADVSNDDTPQSKPDACWWAYDRSSAGQPDDVYPFRAEADWTVYVDAGGVAKAFATFKKYTDLQLPVYDIQTIVVG
jgi:hypothetical protein